MQGDAIAELLHAALRSARQGHPAEERLAYGLLAAGAGELIPEDLGAARDGLWRLAWVAFVRAPARDLGWLITPYLLLDRIYRRESSLADLVERLVGLEREGGGPAAADCGGAGEVPPESPLGRLLAEADRAQELLALSGGPLAEAVRGAILRVRELSRRDGLLARADQGYRAPGRSRAGARGEPLALTERSGARPSGD